MNDEVTTADLCRLLGVSRQSLSNLAKRGIVQRGERKGTYLVEPSIASYCQHLREQASGRGGNLGADVRARLGAAQATLTETKAKQLAGELVEADQVEAKWTSACRAIRARVLAVADRMRDLPARQHVKLSQELRNALSDLADDAARMPGLDPGIHTVTAQRAGAPMAWIAGACPRT